MIRFLLVVNLRARIYALWKRFRRRAEDYSGQPHKPLLLPLYADTEKLGKESCGRTGTAYKKIRKRLERRYQSANWSSTDVLATKNPQRLSHN